MLDYKLSISVSDEVWGTAKVQAALDQMDDEFFKSGGAGAPLTDDSRRRYSRVSAPGRAIALHGQDRYGVITIDISPLGIGFYSPVQLLPKDSVTLFFEPAEQLPLEIRRCVRTEGTTYNCGGVFKSGPLSPADYRTFLSQFRT